MLYTRGDDPAELMPGRWSAGGTDLDSLVSLRLPSDLAEAALRRLRVIALVYSSVFFLAAILPNLVCHLLRFVEPSTVCSRGYFTTLRTIGPPVFSIVGGLAVYLFVRSDRPSVSARLKMGTGFQILGSFGIALSEYQGIVSPMLYRGMETLPDVGSFGLSWVSAWVLMFTTVVPNAPRRALVAALLSVSSVPIVFSMYTALGVNTVRLGAIEFFFALVFPYLLIAGMAWISARVVYRLGREVQRARRLGNYRLTERLGEGGMGEVWKGEHRLLARPAAIKLIRPEALGPVDEEQRQIVLRRFEREAQATAALTSPHTIDLYDFGISEDGTFFAVIEMLRGCDLDSLVRKFGPIPAERVIHFLRQACDSLAEAHESGLIHRDVKPANIFTCRFGRFTDWIKVLDFGMVKLDGGRKDPQLTGESVAAGTPAFMPPEQAVGADVDARSDLYSLGCVAYWLLTGAPVFTGRTPMDTIVHHVRTVPEPPSSRTEIRVPKELDRIVLDCLAKSPPDRPASADELERRLAAVPLEQEWGVERAREWWSLHLPDSGTRSGR
jgi:tRNA A-37 threonylcarbamoyl transferase component Bud32